MKEPHMKLTLEMMTREVIRLMWHLSGKHPYYIKIDEPSFQAMLAPELEEVDRTVSLDTFEFKWGNWLAAKHYVAMEPERRGLEKKAREKLTRKELLALGVSK